MVLTDAGLAFGDADTPSNWVNPTKYAWDDFDWIRYACQTANNENEAIKLLTTDVINQLHATGVSENLFLVGPQQAVIIEADAVRHTIHTINDILVMSNYAKVLWRTQLLKSLPTASSFGTEKDTWLQRGSVTHLEFICGVKIINITQSSITARAVPSFVLIQDAKVVSFAARGPLWFDAVVERTYNGKLRGLVIQLEYRNGVRLVAGI